MRYAECAIAAPIGNWDLTASTAIGELVLVLDIDARPVDPAALAATLHAKVSAASGRRCAYTHLHV